MNTFFIQGDEAQAVEYGELALKAFDECIHRETDPELKAEVWWQKAVTLGGLGRIDDRDVCLHEAERLVPGSTKGRGERLLREAFEAVMKGRDKQ